LLAIPSINICAISCPNNYYKVQSTMTCEPCSTGCNTCSGPLESDCIVEAQQGSLWDQKKEFWIFLIVFCSLLLVTVLVCLILRRRANNKIEAMKSFNEPMMKTEQPTESNMENIPAKLNSSSMADFAQDYKTKTLGQTETISDRENSNTNSSDSSNEAPRKKRKWRGNE